MQFFAMKTKHRYIHTVLDHYYPSHVHQPHRPVVHHERRLFDVTGHQRVLFFHDLHVQLLQCYCGKMDIFILSKEMLDVKTIIEKIHVH